MQRMILLLWMLLCLGAMQAKENPEKEPKNAPGSGKVYRWHTRDGLEYEYYVPKSYDPANGATLLVSFHGSNLSKGWTFWNHQPGSFCKDRIIVSPNGTTANQRMASGKPSCANSSHRGSINRTSNGPRKSPWTSQPKMPETDPSGGCPAPSRGAATRAPRQRQTATANFKSSR